MLNRTTSKHLQSLLRIFLRVYCDLLEKYFSESNLAFYFSSKIFIFFGVRVISKIYFSETKITVLWTPKIVSLKNLNRELPIWFN